MVSKKTPQTLHVLCIELRSLEINHYTDFIIRSLEINHFIVFLKKSSEKRTFSLTSLIAIAIESHIHFLLVFELAYKTRLQS